MISAIELNSFSYFIMKIAVLVVASFIIGYYADYYKRKSKKKDK